MRLFLDTNVVVDSVKFREPYVYAIVPIFQMGQAGIHQLIISDLTFANVAYLSKKGLSLFEGYDLLCELRSNVQIVPIRETSIDAALKLRSKDFEDALQYFSAKEARVDCIITRNKKDFNFSDIPVLEPIEFIAE